MRNVLAAAMAAGAAVTVVSAGAEMPASARPASAVVSQQAVAVGRPVLLVNGDRLMVRPGPGDRSVVSVLPGAAGHGSLVILRLGARTEVIPSDALPYLGRGLDPGLFDLGVLQRAESAGRLPVRVTFRGHRPGLPGVTVTGSGQGNAEGYLTVSSAGAFGAALGRQVRADHARGSYGSDGLFAGGVSVAVAGPPAAARPVRPAFPMRTLTVTGSDLSGKPDNGDIAWVFNADNAARFDDPNASIGFFYHGVAKFSVPAGHYWAVGQFTNSLPRQTYDEHLDVLPEFTVGSNTTVHLDARAATSKIQMVTSRPASPQETDFQLVRTGAVGPAVWIEFLSTFLGVASLYVSPTRAAPATGTLTDITSGQLSSPPAAPGIPYLYDLAYQSHGTIPDQRFVAHQASLATEDARFYSAAPSTGLLARIPVFPIESLLGTPGGGAFPARFPARQTVYLSASPSLLWLEHQQLFVGRGGQTGAPRSFLPGGRLTEDWGDYPLHPAPNVKLAQVSGMSPVPVSASRGGDTLRLDWTAFSDNTPGHTGGGVSPPFTASGSYEIDQNGTKVAGSSLVPFYGFFMATAKLDPARSLIRLVLNSTEPAKLNPLSTTSRTMWTWWSAHESGAMLPIGWNCLPNALPDRACAVQPMMTLDYQVQGLALNGSAPAGSQLIGLHAGHIQLAAAARVTGAAAQVSCNDGKSWQQAAVSSAGGGNFGVAFSAPGGCNVTLRVSAADAAGGSITETITRAYKIAS
jgi:hypothetical protein